MKYYLIPALLLALAVPAAAQQSVVSFTLVNADTNGDIGPLNDGDTLNLATLPTRNLNVRANTSPATVGSVRFGYDGNANYRTESAAPYALEGDNSGNYYAWTPSVGSHTLTATPYTEASGGGTAGTPLSIGFDVIDSPTGPPTADAGPNRHLILPANSTTLDGSNSSDPDGPIASYLWTKESGPSATMGGTTTDTLSLSGLVEGTYVFRLTVTDGDSNTDWDEATVTVSPEGSGAGVVSGELKTWHKVTITWDGPDTSESASTNPFRDYRLQVTFTGPGAQTYEVPGYYAADGDAANTGASSGTKWRCHLAPDEPGTWTYGVSFRTGTDIAVDDSPTAGSSAGYFDGDAGTFAVAPTDKTGRDHRGKGRLEYVGKHHLRFRGNGEYFLKQGADAPENFLAYEDFDGAFKTDGQGDARIKSWSFHAGDWNPGDPSWPQCDGSTASAPYGTEIIGAINYLASEGMNVFSFLPMNIIGDDKNVFPYLTYGERYRMDCSRLDQWEIVFEHADRMGMYLHFKTQETENDQLLDGGALGTQRKLYYRELVARFAHHLALNWNLGEENTNTDAQRKAFSDYFKQIDPYDHLVVVHTYPGDKNTVYTPLLGYPTFDGASLQTSRTDFANVHGDVKTWVVNSAANGRPWVVACDEPGDAQYAIRPDADAANSHVDGRKNALWGAIMAGGAGCEYYFGYAPVHSDLTCQDFRSRDNWWDYCRYALQFFKDNRVPFWDMTCDNGKSSNTNDYCLYKDNDTYVVYLKAGGTTNLDLTGCTGTFTVHWFDPRNGGALQQTAITEVAGGASRALGDAPGGPSTDDWAILVRRLSTVTRPLQDGYNLIALPVVPQATGMKAADLMQSVVDSGVPCTRVLRYNGTGYDIYTAGGGGTNFDVRIGEGYFVRCTASGTWSITGYPFQWEGDRMPLATGYNLVALPLDPAPADRYTASVVVAEVAATGGDATRLLRYNGTGYDVYTAGGGGTNFTLQTGEGYFIRSTKASTWRVSK